MHISLAGLTMIKRFEGLRLTAYICAGNTYTIGYGHTGIDVTANMVLKHKQKRY